MPNTTNLVLPYPDLTNAPNVPSDIAALAQAVDAPFGAWTAWTPVWQQANGTVLAIGNGTMTGRYSQVGKRITAKLMLTRGSTSNVGTQEYQWVLPVPAKDLTSLGAGLVRQVTPVIDILCAARLITTSLLVLTRTDTFARVSHANPGTWAVSDAIQWSITYEAA